MTNKNHTPPSDELLALAHDTHARTIEIDKKLDEQNRLIAESNKAAAKTGAISGAIAGGLVATGIELLKAKFGW